MLNRHQHFSSGNLAAQPMSSSTVKSLAMQFQSVQLPSAYHAHTLNYFFTHNSFLLVQQNTRNNLAFPFAHLQFLSTSLIGLSELQDINKCPLDELQIAACDSCPSLQVNFTFFLTSVVVS